MVTPTAAMLLAELMSEYLEDHHELLALALLYGVDLEFMSLDPSWLEASRHLIEQLEHGQTRVFVDDLVIQLEIRIERLAVSTGFEYRAHHEGNLGVLARLKEELGEPVLRREVNLPERHQFAAKSELRDFLESAETEILIVDPYIGVGTLDCLRTATESARILTGTKPQSIEEGFGRALADYRGEGRDVEVRRHDRLHDRHVAFNGRIWLVGSSLKDAGNKAFNCIEIIDTADQVLAQLERDWEEAETT